MTWNWDAGPRIFVVAGLASLIGGAAPMISGHRPAPVFIVMGLFAVLLAFVMAWPNNR